MMHLDTTERAASAINHGFVWERTPGKYGRPTVRLDRIGTDIVGGWVSRDRDLAVVVTLRRSDEDPMRYLVNVRPLPAEVAAGKYTGDVSYYRTRRAAIQHAEAQVAAKLAEL